MKNIFNKGLTLIEVIVSVALLAIVSIMLFTIMATALAAVKSTRTRTNHTAAAAAQIEKKHAENSSALSDSSLTISFSGKQYEVSGSYISGCDGGITYYEFVPDN